MAQAQANLFAGLNEEMASIIADTVTSDFTPANLFAKILSGKNQVSEYFKGQSDIKKIIIDFENLNENQRGIEKYTKHLENFLSSIENSTPDRYVNEVRFMTLVFNSRNMRNIFMGVAGKYLKPDHIVEDIEKMIKPIPNTSWEKQEKTILDALGRNLTELAGSGELSRVVDREEEMMRIIQILTRQSKSNPVLVGEAGVGKTAVVEKLAFVLNEKVGVPSSLHGYSLYEISIPAIIATGDIESSIESIIETAKRDKCILFMDEVHLIMEQQGKIANLLKPAMARGDFKLIGATTEDEYKTFEHDKAMTRRFQPVKINAPEKTSVYRILKSKAREAEELHNVLIPDRSLLKAIQLSERYIQNRQQPDKAIDLIEEASAKLRMILESKPEPLIEIENKVSDLEIEREMIYVKYPGPPYDVTNERDRKKSMQIDEDLLTYEKELKRLTKEYFEQRQLLESVITFKEKLKEAEIEKEEALHIGEFEKAAKIEAEDLPRLKEEVKVTEEKLLSFAETADENLIQNVVTPNMLSRIIEDQTGIPVTAQDEEDLEKYRNMEVVLMKEVHGQDKPIREISAAIKRSKAGMSDPNKPLGSFMCLGPTGVGKTYLAQQIAKFMFDTDKVMHRFDMSEFMEAHSVSRLFGSPPGYVGHDEGGQLTEAVKRNPYSIILFDEIEKAHPRVFDSLLQILDAGRMTDGKGEVVNFKNTIVIMTSNIGANIIREGLEKGYPQDAIEIAIFDEIKNHFRPEFLNRFDAKVVFNSLAPQAVVGIAESELNKLAERLLADNDIELHWHKDMAIMVTNNAYDVADGARPIKRFINNIVVNKLTEAILNGEAKHGGTIYIRPNPNDPSDIILMQVNQKELKEFVESETEEISLDDELVLKTGATNKYKVSSDQIVDADVDQNFGSDSSKNPKKSKKQKKSKKKKFMDEEFKLDTQAGD